MKDGINAVIQAILIGGPKFINSSAIIPNANILELTPC
jgi:hypothetical protein